MKKLDYDPELYIEYAMQFLEGDVCYISRKYFIDGYNPEDLAQELRLNLWQKLVKYNHTITGLRAWGDKVMRNHMRDLLRKASAKKRGYFVGINDDSAVFERDLDLIIDICTENDLNIEEFF